jgi:hypothetical protein
MLIAGAALALTLAPLGMAPASAAPAPLKNAACSSGDIVNDYGSCSGGFAIADNGHDNVAAVDYSGTPWTLTFHDYAGGVDWYTISHSSLCLLDGGSALGYVGKSGSCPGGLGGSNTSSSEWWGLYYQSGHGCDAIKNRHTGENLTAETIGGALVHDAGGPLRDANCWGLK